jgi:hypothetical protein
MLLINFCSSQVSNLIFRNIFCFIPRSKNDVSEIIIKLKFDLKVSRRELLNIIIKRHPNNVE